MRVVTNETLSSRNRRIATILFFATFVILIIGFFAVNSLVSIDFLPTELIIVLQILILPIAFVMTLISVRMTNLWSRVPRPEDAIEEGLKGLSRKSVLYSYFHFPARHILVAPQGVFAIEPRWHDGKFTVNGDEWKSHRSFIGRAFSLMRMDGIGNPNKDATNARNHVESLMESIDAKVKVQPLIVFVDSRAELEIIDPNIPVLYADSKQSPNLRDYMRDLNTAVQTSSGKNKKVLLPLSDDQIESFEEATIP